MAGARAPVNARIGGGANRARRAYRAPMDWKLIATIFGSVFVAELGDKTQLATMLFASKDGVSRWQVFAGAAAALVVSTALGVFAGKIVSTYVSEQTLKYVAGVGFVLIGAWTLWKA
jgi:putative Ca2+/H+ antiporter (TMEM165/GDT1 family)